MTKHATRRRTSATHSDGVSDRRQSEGAVGGSLPTAPLAPPSSDALAIRVTGCSDDEDTDLIENLFSELTSLIDAAMLLTEGRELGNVLGMAQRKAYALDDLVARMRYSRELKSGERGQVLP